MPRDLMQYLVVEDCSIEQAERPGLAEGVTIG
jgi:hypothetical protein